MDFYVRKLQETIASSFAGITPEQFKWHPQEKWGAAEIMEHLWLTYSATTTAFDLCLQAGKIATTKPTLQMRIDALMVLKLEYFPSGRPAPPGTIPQGASPELVRARIQGDIVAMDESIRKCEERFGSRRDLVDNPVLGPLTGAEWRKFHWLHARHHARQIESLKRGMSNTNQSVDQPLTA
jgi:hypothetical protein